MNKNQFRSARPKDLTRNLAGGAAYALSQEAALAQYVLTGTFNSTFYADADDDVARIAQLAVDLEPKFIAQLAVYGREHGYMKDAPALLLAVLVRPTACAANASIFQGWRKASGTTRTRCFQKHFGGLLDNLPAVIVTPPERPAASSSNPV